MKFIGSALCTLLAISSSRPSVTVAWTTAVVPTSSARTFVSMMGSRSAEKKETRQQWSEKRGYAASSSSSSSEFCTIIGGGRIGSLFAEGGDHTLLGRGDSIPEDGTGPIFVATRNDSLDPIVEACPPNRRRDLVFVQNGYLDDFLASKGLMDNTQALLFVSVTAKGADPIDGITAVNPEGLTAATGEHADALAGRLAALGLKCNVLSAEEYRPAMFEKLIWIATYMLVGAARGCASVGEAGEKHGDVVEKVVNELVDAVSAKEGIEFQPGTMERLAAYTDVVATFPAAVKEFEWRNKYFYDLGDEACPTHNALLRECAEKGVLGFELP